MLITRSTYGSFKSPLWITPKILFTFRTRHIHKFAPNQDIAQRENRGNSLLGLNSPECNSSPLVQIPISYKSNT